MDRSLSSKCSRSESDRTHFGCQTGLGEPASQNAVAGHPWPIPLRHGPREVPPAVELVRSRSTIENRSVRIFSLAAAVVAGQLVIATQAGDPIRANRGMVVSAHPLASQAGIEILQRGGNAVDAAIATGLALAVTHPAAGNIGGGGFMVLALSDGRTTTIDFREVAPAAAREDMFLGPDGQLVPGSNHKGFRAVGVPGTIAGFDLALKRYGRKSWRDVTRPAVALAREGFPLTPALATEFKQLQGEWKQNPAAAAIFLRPDGRSWNVGEIWRQPDLAATLERIQQHGRSGFYRGPTAQRLADAMRRHGGLITRQDLAHYHAIERAPVRGNYHGWEVVSMAPPSSGGIALIEMLNLLESRDLRSLGHNSAPYLHLLAEVMRRAFADRARFLGDPEATPDMSTTTRRLTSKAHAARLGRTIDPDQSSPSDPGLFQQAYESPETTHYSVIDADGNAAVVTYTLEDSYGARVVAEGLGFLLNNEMGDFNPQPGRTDATGLIGTPPNLVRPGRRMLSSMTPTILRRAGKPVLLLGSPGGRTIINTVLQVVLNRVDFNLDPVAAVAAPRIHQQWLPNEIVLEGAGGSESSVWPQEDLEKRGHHVRRGGPQGRVMLIQVEDSPTANGRYFGVPDPRDPDAAAAGY